MSLYATIDPILLPWADTHGFHVYSGHRDNVVRSITVYVWIGARHESTGHIWLDPPGELGLVGLHAAQGTFRFDEAVPLQNLKGALDVVLARLDEHRTRATA